jgi:NitT/TauT family transport system permease protein
MAVAGVGTRPRRQHPHLPAISVAIPPALISLGIAGVAWEVLAWIWDVPFFPPLTAVLARLVEMIQEGLIVGNLVTSLTNLVIGFTISVVCGITIGVLMGRFRKVEAALDIYVNALLTAPSLVFAPIFFTIWGLGRESIVAVIVMYSIFIIIINTAAAVRNAPGSLVEMARSYNTGEWQMFWRVVLPSATPLIMAGVRLGVGRAVKGMINGEMFIAVVGLGSVVMAAGRQLDAESVLAVLIVIVVVAFAAIWVVQWVDRRLTSWLPSTARGG